PQPYKAELLEMEPVEIAKIPMEILKRVPPAPKSEIIDKQIVETEESSNKTLDPNTKFLSNKTQTAEEQMKAKTVDDFRSKKGSGLKMDASAQSPHPSDRPETEAGRSEIEVADGDQKIGIAGGMKKDWKTLSLRDLGIGDGGPTGATDDHLKEVAPGERTILSTREFVYFSYYHRIKEVLRQFWKPLVERKLVKLWERGKTMQDEEVTTKLLVLLDEGGKIQKISRVSTSGIDDIDTAAMEAFHHAAPFPHPPRGLVDNDGFVRIRWDFILRAETGPRIQFSAGGGARPPP
ncbi:MAG: energy transducer TonB, partial [Deltaproteobacteria bacterium]|nr:energy transducer TonB [Deltaproteobacteria bacterium]